MNLAKKKQLAAKALGVGKNRVTFKSENLSEIKEAITREDIKSLHKEGVISIKPVKGRKKIVRRKTRRGPGKIKKKVNKRKEIYVKITRKLRGYLMRLRDEGKVDRELYWKIRNKIRMRDFKSKANLKDYLKGLEIPVDEAVKVKKEKTGIKKTGEAKKKETKKADGKTKDKGKEGKK